MSNTETQVNSVIDEDFFQTEITGEQAEPANQEPASDTSHEDAPPLPDLDEEKPEPTLDLQVGEFGLTAEEIGRAESMKMEGKFKLEGWKLIENGGQLDIEIPDNEQGFREMVKGFYDDNFIDELLQELQEQKRVSREIYVHEDGTKNLMVMILHEDNSVEVDYKTIPPEPKPDEDESENRVNALDQSPTENPNELSPRPITAHEPTKKLNLFREFLISLATDLRKEINQDAQEQIIKPQGVEISKNLKTTNTISAIENGISLNIKEQDSEVKPAQNQEQVTEIPINQVENEIITAEAEPAKEEITEEPEEIIQLQTDEQLNTTIKSAVETMEAAPVTVTVPAQRPIATKQPTQKQHQRSMAAALHQTFTETPAPTTPKQPSSPDTNPGSPEPAPHIYIRDSLETQLTEVIVPQVITSEIKQAEPKLVPREVINEQQKLEQQINILRSFKTQEPLQVKKPESSKDSVPVKNELPKQEQPIEQPIVLAVENQRNAPIASIEKNATESKSSIERPVANTASTTQSEPQLNPEQRTRYSSQTSQTEETEQQNANTNRRQQPFTGITLAA